MTFWFYDSETNSLRYATVDGDTPLAVALRASSRTVSPALWLYSIVGLLRYLGNDLPLIPTDPDSGAVLVFWDKDGEAAFFPLTTSGHTMEDATELGHALHHVAQMMIENPDVWFRMTVPEDEDGMEDGEEEEGDFSYQF